MKQFFQRFMMIAGMLLSFCSVSAYDFELPAGNVGMQKLQYSILSSVEQTVAGVGGTTGIIPCQVTYNNKTYTVTEIGRYAFSDVNITDFRLPLTLKKIRSNAFGWSKASVIAIPDGVDLIESDAFWCSEIETIVVGSGVQTIGDGAFYGCSKLKTLVLKPQTAPSHVSRGYLIGNSATTVIVPQLKGYTGSEFASVVAGSIIEPIYFDSNSFVYSGEIPTLSYAKTISSATLPSDMALKNKDAGEYQQSFFIGLSSIVPSYRFSDFDGYATFPACGVDVVYSYNIAPKPLYININNEQRIYGDLNPSNFTYSIDGFVNGESESVLDNSIIPQTSATITSSVGEYPITYSGTARNYELIVTNGILTITKAPLIVQVENAEKVYGENNPTFKYKFINLRNNDTPELLTPLNFETATKFSDVGVYPIKCSEGSLRNYELTEYLDGTLTIKKAPLTLAANDAERVYYENNPQFTFTLIGLRNNDNVTCLTTQPTFECEASLTSDCGSYSITPFSAEAHNYDISYKTSVLTITPASLTVQAVDVAREYGEENPILKYALIGLRGNDDENKALQEPPVVTTTATIASNVGDYSIIANGGTSKNYTLSYRSGVLTITKAPLTVVAENTERIYGDNNPSFVRSYFGFKLSDSENNAFSVLPKISCSATKTSNVGEYPITITGGISKNYELTEYLDGTLTIKKAPLTLAANDAERVYYENNPQFTFTLIGLRNNDNVTCLTTQPTFECEASLTSDCGSYSITPFSAEAHNYDISYKTSVLTITPASLTVQAVDVAREYGEENPILKYALIGLRGNDDENKALQEPPVVTTTATIASNVGDYSIIANGGTSKNYTLSYRSGVLTITKAPLTVVAENTERIYGDNNPSFVRSYFGFKLSDSENNAFSVLPKISCSATKTSNVGEYPITITGGISKNYEVMSYENGILTITKATAILTPINKERYYFEENPSFDFTLTGLRNNDSKSCVTILPQYSCSATKLSNVGIYPINASDASATNYNFEYGQGSLTISPRQLTASVGNDSRVDGTENPTFEITYTGFVNNEDATALNQLSVATCSATILNDVGSYPITVSGGSATNYIITNYNNGLLTIEKADQTIIWNQDLSGIELYSQIELDATCSSGLPVSYEMSPNNVATLYNNAGKWYLDCYGSGATNIRAIQNGDRNHNASSIISKTLIVYGAGDDPQNPQIYLNIEEPGTLSTMIADNRKYQIKNLRLTGYLNGTDICFLREMSGSDSNGNTTPGVLETLDILGCTIVEGGRSYYKSSRTTDYVVGDNIFYNCKVLTTLHLPNNSVRIGNNSLADCDRLSVISIPNSVKKIGTEAFKNDISLMRIPMPNALTTIEDLAFMGCNGITELTIPSEVSVIGDGIVKDCQNIERISVDNDNSNFASVDGVLFNKNQDRLIIFPVNHSMEYTAPEGVKTIAPYAFVNSKKLKSVSLPSSMSIIGQDAFIGCVNLQTLKVQAITPPVCQNDCFESVSKTRCKLQVPMGCHSSYWVAPVWSEFNNIVETVISGIDQIYYNDVHIEITNGKISISGCTNDLITRIYHINGTLLYQSETSDNVVEYEPSSHGVYLVVIGNKTYKVSL